MKGGRRDGIAWVSYELAGGDPELALLLAIDAMQLIEQGLTPRSSRLAKAVEDIRRERYEPTPPPPAPTPSL